MKKVYKEIAKNNNVSVRQIKKDMQEAVNAAYINPNFHAKCVHSKEKVPTSEELIEHIIRRML